jgi:predicted Zn-dependent protease
MEQSSNFKSRLIGALIIACIGLAMYWFHTEKNPVTGEIQHVSISPEQEIRLGLESAPQMARQMGGEEPSNDPRVMEVQRIGKQLVGSFPEAVDSPWKFQFHLLADRETINAFALPGGQVFITLGLLNKLQNEAQLAGVIGHEIGHVIERHSAQQMAKNQLGQSLLVAVAAGTEQERRSIMLAQVVNQMIQLRYGRKDESQADLWGLKLMEKAGYNPFAMIEVMKILKEASGGGRGIELFQSHPNPELRMEQIKAYLQEHPPRSGLTDGRPLAEVYGSLRSREFSNEESPEESGEGQSLEDLLRILFPKQQ